MLDLTPVGPGQTVYKRDQARIAALEAELAERTWERDDERKRREDAEAALGAVVACHNSDPILIAREPGYRWHDVIKQAIAHFARYKD